MTNEVYVRMPSKLSNGLGGRWYRIDMKSANDLVSSSFLSCSTFCGVLFVALQVIPGRTLATQVFLAF